MVRTHELLAAFGWSAADKQIQQDASEFQLYLVDRLEKELQGTAEEELFTGLFYGQKENVIKCLYVNYESVTKETFNNLSVHL